MRLLQIRSNDGLHRLLADFGGPVRVALAREFEGRLDLPRVDDAIAQAIVRVWRGAGAIDLRRGGLGAWFLALARASARRLLGSSRRARPHAIDPADLAATPPPAAIDPATTALLRRKIDALPPQQRAVLLADLTAGGLAAAAEIALMLGTTVNSVYVSRSKGRQALRRALRQDASGQDGADKAGV